MFEYDEFGNPIPLGTAQVSTMGSRRDASGAYTGMMPGLPLNPMSAGGPNMGGLMPTYQIPQRVSAGNQNELFEMPGFGQQAYGMGGATDYTGGFNTTGGGNFAPGLAGMQGFSPAPEADISLTSENPLFNVQPFGNAPEADIPLNFPDGPTNADFPMEFRSLEGIQDMDLLEEADIPLDFDPSSIAKKAQSPAVNTQATMVNQGGSMKLQGAGMAASGILGIAGGVTDIIQGGRNMRSAQSDQAKQQAEIDKLKASQPSLSTPAEYYERVKNAYDSRLMQMRNEDINRNLSNTTAAAASFGSRGLGALAGATQAANRAQREETLIQQQRQTDALGDLATAQERTIGRKEDRNVRETGYAQGQLEQAQQMELMAQQQRMAGISSAVGGVAQTALGFGTMGTGNALLKAGGVAFEDGGKVQKTPGKFSHEENEMAVITEEGEDTGVRVTGGEYVLNPDQAKTIKKLVESGDADKLMKFMDDLLDEPQFS